MYEDPSDEPLESLLRDHFAGELDPQLGRARAAFEQFTGEVPVERNKRWTAGQRTLWASMAAALAATIMVAVVLNRSLQQVAMPERQPQPANSPSPQQPAAPPKEAIVHSPKAETTPSASKADPLGPPEAIAAAAEPLQPGEESQILVKQGVEWRLLDSEIVQLDAGTSVRKSRRQRLEEREYLDRQHGARMKLYLPREEVRFESIPTQ